MLERNENWCFWSNASRRFCSFNHFSPLCLTMDWPKAYSHLRQFLHTSYLFNGHFLSLDSRLICLFVSNWGCRSEKFCRFSSHPRIRAAKTQCKDDSSPFLHGWANFSVWSNCLLLDLLRLEASLLFLAYSYCHLLHFRLFCL